MYAYGYRYNSGLVIGAGGGAPFSNTKSLLFDGVDDRVSLSSSVNLGINSTVSFWIKRNRVNSIEVFLGENTYANKRLISVGNNHNYVYIEIGSFYIGWANTDTILNNTIDWFNICFIRSGDSVELFINGVSMGFQTGFGTLINTKFDTIATQTSSSTYAFQGNIDEVAGWNTNTINPVDIYNLGTPTDLSLLATPPLHWYRMGDNGSWKSPQWLIPNNENKDKVSNYSLQFPNYTTNVNIGNIASVSNTTQFSASFWFNANNVTTQSFLWSNGANSSNLFGPSIIANDIIMYAGGSANYLRTNGAILSINTWYNLTIIYDGSLAVADRYKIYLDGVQIGTTTTGTPPAITPTFTTDLLIGQLSYGGYSMYGKISNAAFFDNAISIGDVWDGSGEPIDISAVSGITNSYNMGDNSTWATEFTVPDEIGVNNGLTTGLTDAIYRIGEAPNSTSNAVSLNMDEVDRVTDVPT